MYEFCTDELQQKLRANREAADKAFEKDLKAKSAKISSESTPAGGKGSSSSSSSISSISSSSTSNAAAVVPPPAPAAAAAAAPVSVVSEDMDDDEAEALALEQALKMSLGETAAAVEDTSTSAAGAPAAAVVQPVSGEKMDVAAPTAELPAPVVNKITGPVSLGNGLPMGFTGQYELNAIVTHKGRSADSGHYIGWVRQSPGSQFWWCYDDDKVTEVRNEEIMKLCGGGDRDMAYLNFYRFKEGK